MEPIINPWVFYLISTLDNLKFLAGVLLVIGGFMSIFMAMYCLELNSEEICELQKTSFFRRHLTITTTCLLLVIFIPSKETIYQMLIAQHITPDNLAAFKGEAVNLVDYIVGQIKALKN